MKTTPSRALPPHRVTVPEIVHEAVYETGGSDPDFYFPPRREGRSMGQRVRGLPVLRSLLMKPGRRPGA